MPCLGTDKLVDALSSPAMLISSNEESTHEKSGADGDGGLDGGDGGLDGRTENVARRENVAIFRGASKWCEPQGNAVPLAV